MSDIKKIIFDNNAGYNMLNMATDNIVVGRYISDTGTEEVNAAYFYNSEYISVNALGVYRFQVSSSVDYISIMEYDTNKAFISRTLYGDDTTPAGTYITHTVGQSTAYILIGACIDEYALTLPSILSLQWMLTEGPEERVYEAYIPPLSCNVRDYRIPSSYSIEHMYFRGDGIWAVPTLRYTDCDTYLLVHLQ